MKNRKILRFIIISFLIWRGLLALISFVGYNYFPTLGEQDNIVRHERAGDFWTAWASWDGGHFRGIAENGYLPEQTVFFPGYPLFIKILMNFGIPSLLAGLVISNISLITALFFLYKLILLDFTEKVAKRSVIALLIFPTSFFLAAVYSESLFLAATTGAFYLSRTKRYGWTAILVALAVSTRLVGIAVVAGIFVEYFLQNKKIFTRQNFLLFSSLLPLWLYIIFQNYFLNNSLGFLFSQYYWGREPSAPWSPLINFLTSLKINKLFELNSEAISIHEFSFFAIGIIGLIISYQKLRKSFFVYYLISFFIPLFSGTLLSFPRFLLVIFPVYILLALVRNKQLQITGILISILLLIFYSIRFVNNLWVS